MAANVFVFKAIRRDFVNFVSERSRLWNKVLLNGFREKNSQKYFKHTVCMTDKMRSHTTEVRLKLSAYVPYSGLECETLSYIIKYFILPKNLCYSAIASA